MAPPPDHLRYLKQNFSLGCESVPFDEEERETLSHYGAWMEALATGKIQPYTEAQHQFIRCVRDDSIEPQTEYERIYRKLLDRRNFEREFGTTPKFHVYDEAEAWFPRHEHWRYR